MSKELEVARKFELTKSGKIVGLAAVLNTSSFAFNLFTGSFIWMIVSSVALAFIIGTGIQTRDVLIKPKAIAPAKEDPWAPKYSEINWEYVAAMEHEAGFGHLSSESFKACTMADCRRSMRELDAITNPEETAILKTKRGNVFEDAIGVEDYKRSYPPKRPPSRLGKKPPTREENYLLAGDYNSKHHKTDTGSVVGRRNPDLPFEVQAYRSPAERLERYRQMDARGVLTSRELREMQELTAQEARGRGYPVRIFPEYDFELYRQLPDGSSVENVHDNSGNVINQIIHTTVNGEPTTMMRAAWDREYEKQQRAVKRKAELAKLDHKTTKIEALKQTLADQVQPRPDPEILDPDMRRVYFEEKAREEEMFEAAIQAMRYYGEMEDGE